MKNVTFMLFLILSISACQNNTNETQAASSICEAISKADFASKMKEKKITCLIDIRTSCEFAGGQSIMQKA